MDQELREAITNLMKSLTKLTECLTRMFDDTPLGSGKLPEPCDFDHSDDFRTVQWRGQCFQFSRLRAACIKVLWTRLQQGVKEMPQAAILAEAGSEQRRLDHVFREPDQSYHPAWGAMIVRTSQGCYALDLTPNEKNPEAATVSRVSVNGEKTLHSRVCG